MVEEIVERFVMFRVQKVVASKGYANPEALIEVARETTMTLLNLVQIQFGVFGLREIAERMKDFTDWEASQVTVSLSEKKSDQNVMYS